MPRSRQSLSTFKLSYLQNLSAWPWKVQLLRLSEEALPKREALCWWRRPSFGKSRDKFRSVGWIPHKYQRAFANFQFLFRAKRLLLLRFPPAAVFVSDCEDGWRGQQWCGTLWTSWPALRLQKRKLQAAHRMMEAGAGMEGKSRRKLDFEDCLRWLGVDWGDPTNSISFSNSPNAPPHMSELSILQAAKLFKTEMFGGNVWRKSCLPKTIRYSKQSTKITK